jgi:hypothetical protein
VRTLLRLTIPTDVGNETIANGSLPKILEATMQKLKPEAAYFFTEGGERTAIVVFDMKDASELATIAEPLFSGLGAAVEFFPVMNNDDLQKGLGAL